MDAVEGACDTNATCLLLSWEVRYAPIHLQNARGRGRDPDALRRGVGRAWPRLRKPERRHAPRRHARHHPRPRGRPTRGLLAGRQRPEPYLPLSGFCRWPSATASTRPTSWGNPALVRRLAPRRRGTGTPSGWRTSSTASAWSARRSWASLTGRP